MKVLIATSQGQGRAEGDFSWTVEGELVTLPVVLCDCPECGCDRAVAGLSSSKATTTFMVADRPDLDPVTYRTLIEDGLLRQGWIASTGEEWTAEFARAHLEIAARWPDGEVLEIADEVVRPRKR